MKMEENKEQGNGCLGAAGGCLGKKIGFILFSLLIANLLLLSCNSRFKTSDPEKNVHVTDSGYTPVNEPLIQMPLAKDLPDYMLRYATYVNDSNIVSDADRYTMVYIDKDTIPEMIIDTGCNAGGYIVLSLQGDKVLSYTTCRLALTYIEKSGLMRNESGAQEEYFATIIKLSKSKFEELAYWKYSYSRDERYRIIRSILNGKPTKVKEVRRHLGKLYNDRKAIDVDSIQEWESLSELRNIRISANSNDSDGFSCYVPRYMKPRKEVFDESNLMSFRIWAYSKVLLVYIPPMGNWAVDEYPKVGKPVAPDVEIKDVTYRNSNGTLFSGHTADGRVWYMKKRILDKATIPHASALVCVYHKSKFPKVEKELVDIVKNW